MNKTKQFQGGGKIALSFILMLNLNRNVIRFLTFRHLKHSSFRSVRMILMDSEGQDAEF
jgi:hypothetical protein